MLQLPPAEAFFQGYISRHFLWWDALQKNCAKNKRKIEKHQHFRTLGICSCLASAAPLQEMSGEHLRLASNSAACPTIARHSIFSIFFCEHLRSILKKSRCASTFWDQFNVFAGRDFCIGPRPAAVFRRAHMQAQAAAARGSRRAGLQQRSEPSPYVASVVQTPPQHFQKKKNIRKTVSRLVFRVRRQGFLYRPRPPVAAVVQGFSSDFHVLEQSVRILCLANEVGLQLSIVCFQPSTTCEVS